MFHYQLRCCFYWVSEVKEQTDWHKHAGKAHSLPLRNHVLVLYSRCWLDLLGIGMNISKEQDMLVIEYVRQI